MLGRRYDEGENKMSKWTVSLYHCSCHPDTCNCRRWRVYDPSNDWVASFSDERDALNLIDKIRQFSPAAPKPFIRENRDLLMRNYVSHELFQTGDPGCPEQALDWNGEVVLGVCKNCGRVEAELDEHCDHRTLIKNLRAEIASLTSPKG